jgi:hypothetical protein
MGRERAHDGKATYLSHRSTGSRWSIWSGRAARLRSCRGSSNRPPKTIRNWVREAEGTGGGAGDGVSPEEQEELKRLGRENKQSRLERENPGKSRGLVRSGDRGSASDADARLAARLGTVVVTTVGGVREIDPAGPDSLLRARFDRLHARNLRLLRQHGVRLALGSDDYGDTSPGEAMYLHGLSVFDNLPPALVRGHRACLRMSRLGSRRMKSRMIRRSIAARLRDRHRRLEPGTTHFPGEIDAFEHASTLNGRELRHREVAVSGVLGAQLDLLVPAESAPEDERMGPD